MIEFRRLVSVPTVFVISPKHDKFYINQIHGKKV